MRAAGTAVAVGCGTAVAAGATGAVVLVGRATGAVVSVGTAGAAAVGTTGAAAGWQAAKTMLMRITVVINTKNFERIFSSNFSKLMVWLHLNLLKKTVISYLLHHLLRK